MRNIRHDFGGKHEVSLVLQEFGRHAEVVRGFAASLRDASVDKGDPGRVAGREPSLMVRLPCPPVDVLRIAP